MASKACSSLAIFLTLNLIFFSLVSACGSYSCPGPSPKPKPTPSPSPSGSCPRDALKLGVCANVLNGLVNATLGQPPVTPCCSLLDGLVDLEAAVCLCTALKADGSFKISKAPDEVAAWGLWWLPKLHADQTQHISAHTELKGVFRATPILCGRWLWHRCVWWLFWSFWGWLWHRRVWWLFGSFWGWVAWHVCGANHTEKQDVQTQEKSTLRSHFTLSLQLPHSYNTLHSCFALLCEIGDE
ncbi:hypothetical protein LR48_Vigan01g215300 [Vigna angularis]|uniref:Bifunctional inhibitor/plant lipid transfer protein/seed storage helical domain-containing protein n=1 Tax=Phaseolus angularis TaxID=3914 RepID=A0A0L9TQA6_PHAAN|nr:hypothetical protein LR48_Vigan01g215300 [Vigna angularis]